jgi:photosystem II stability/assembly factor-like uncharacterized protein
MKIFVGLLLMLLFHTGFAQNWRLLSGSPTSASFRHDDLFFINEDTGWVCNVDGKIYQTVNAGANWKTLVNMPAVSFRCIGFINAQKGWAGNLGQGRWSPTIDTMPLYETTDGGNTWQPVTSISGTLPKGICGINVVNESVVYAVGRVGGPAYLLKTTNGGASWNSIDMNSLANQLIDCRFFSPDTGFVIGSYALADSLSKYRILYTTNGGATWQVVASGLENGFNCWKIFFTNRQTGYVSIEGNTQSDSVYFLKTINGGISWQKNAYSKANSYGGQGIGFINDSVGWCGFLTGDTKQTSDGGKTWTDENTILHSLNRIRVINSNTAYAVGKNVWKYSYNPTGINNPDVKSLPGFTVSAFPNPFIENTTIEYQIPESGQVSIRLYDFSGRPISTLHDDYDMAGKHLINVNLKYYLNTHFYVVITFKDHQNIQKIIANK